MSPANHPATHGVASSTEHGASPGVGKSRSLTDWLELTGRWPQFFSPERLLEPSEEPIMHASATKSDSVLVACPDCHTLVRVPRDRLGDDPTCAKCKSTVTSGSPVTLDAQSFETHTTRSGLPVLVDFWAPWCGPCRAMAPMLDRVADERRTALQVGKLNTDENQDIAVRLGIRSIPTLIIYRDGKELARRSGVSDFSALARWIDDVIQH